MDDHERTDLCYDLIFWLCAFTAFGLFIGIIGLALQ